MAFWLGENAGLLCGQSSTAGLRRRGAGLRSTLMMTTGMCFDMTRQTNNGNLPPTLMDRANPS